MQALYEDCLCQQLYYGLCLVRSYFLDSHPNKEDTCIKKEKKSLMLTLHSLQLNVFFPCLLFVLLAKPVYSHFCD